MVRRALGILFAAATVASASGTTEARPASTEDAVVPVAEKPGDPCCDAVWCISQEGLCTQTCATKYKRGSAKWIECHKYCSGALERCTKCCRKHRVPSCDTYCFD